MIQKLNTAQMIGSVFTLAGAALQLFEFKFSKYIFAAGALTLIVVYFIQNFRAKNESKRVQRMYRLMIFASLFLGVGAYLMFTGEDTWVVMVLLYALISVFLSFRNTGSKTE